MNDLATREQVVREAGVPIFKVEIDLKTLAATLEAKSSVGSCLNCC